MKLRAALIAIAGLFAGGAAAEPAINAVEAVLSRSLLERGAFLACAPLSPESTLVVEHLKSGWAADIGDTQKALREASYPAAFVDAIPTRFAIETGTPRFASDAERKAFCTMLGDWEMRHALFLVSFPQLEIKKIIAN